MIQFQFIPPDANLSDVVQVLTRSHGTVAQQFGFTKETNPTNSAFIDAPSLRGQLEKGIELYLMVENRQPAGCIAIEKSKTEADTFYIEKVSVIPECRNHGLGVELMNFATLLIQERGGKYIGISLIDSHAKLKNWYLKQGFTETSTRDFPHLPFRVCFMKKEII